MNKNDQQIKFSIIVPIYNVEKYIEKCIVSLLNQTYKSYEILLIDDGSTDKSREIAEKIKEQYPNIRIIAQENKGLGGARNTGVSYAKGEYILFVDSDDYVKANYLENATQLLRDNKDIDVLCYNIIEVDETGREIRRLDMNEGILGAHNVKMTPKMLLLNPSACNKIYRKEFYLNSKITYPEKTLYEDTAATRKLLLSAETVYFSDDAFYYYVQRQGSITHSKPSQRCLDIIKEVESLKTFLTEREELNRYSKELEAVAVISVLLFALGKVNESDYKNSLQDDFVQYILDNFPQVLHNEYLSKSVKKRCEILLKKRFKFYHYRYVRLDSIKRAVKGFIKKFLMRRY